MYYQAFYFRLQPLSSEFTEILSALLDQQGFEGITEEEETLTGYIPEDQLADGAIDTIRDSMISLGCKIEWTTFNIPEQNWNKVWESNFEPVVIDTRCAIRAPFHREYPEVQYQITIEPKMSFGTGHHQTTRMMLEQILSMDLSGKKVLDMGCGTAVLSILASMHGASHITAIDIDKWAVENSIENAERNNISNIEVLPGGKNNIPDCKYDIIFANINRNILIDQMNDYARVLKSKGLLLLSGILIEDIDIMNEKAGLEGFRFVSSNRLANWAFLMFERN